MLEEFRSEGCQVTWCKWEVTSVGIGQFCRGPEGNLLQSKQREIRGQKQPEHKNYIEATRLKLHVNDEMEAMNLQRSHRRVWKK